MTECLHHRTLCDQTVTTGSNTHRCFLDHNHPTDRHICVCWYRWSNR